MAKELLEAAKKTPYPVEAFLFVHKGLDFTVRHIHGECKTPKQAEDDATRKTRHVSGQQLCTGLKDFAIEQYGLLARSVLRRWNIHTCADFGKIVFTMVESGLLQKTDNDTLNDFRDVFDFDEAFGRQLVLKSKD